MSVRLQSPIVAIFATTNPLIPIVAHVNLKCNIKYLATGTNIRSVWPGGSVEPTREVHMPKNIVLFKERTLRRAIRAVKKEGLVPKAATVAPDGTMSVSFAEPPPSEVSPELDGEIEKFTESLWDRDYGKPAA